MRATVCLVQSASATIACTGQDGHASGTLVAPTPPTMSPNAIASGRADTTLATSWQCLTSTSWTPAGCQALARPHPGTAAPLSAPSSPSGLAAVVAGNRVTLSWSGDGVSSYVLEAGSGSGLTNLANVDVGIGTTLVVDSVPAATYYVRVRARNASGLSAPSNEIVVVVAGSSCAIAPASPTGLTTAITGNSVLLTWVAPSAGCTPTSYRIEAGSAPGLSNLAVVNTGTTATSFSATGVAAGAYYVRVRGTNNAGAGPASNEVVLTVGTTGMSPFMRDYIQAIFLGSGPLSPADGNYACPTFAGTWTGFPCGTVVSVRVSMSESTDKRQAIQNAAAQVSSATLAAIQTVFTLTDDPNPTPGPNEATSTSDPTPSTQGCPSDNGCTIHSFVSIGVLRSSRAVQPPIQTPNAFAHDIIGHGVMGMCHVDGHLIGGAALSLMSGGPNVFSGQIAVQLTALDIAAAQAVYGSGLNPGATKGDFLRAGLINGSTTQTTMLMPLFQQAGKQD